jgi:hypothetical protein
MPTTIEPTPVRRCQTTTEDRNRIVVASGRRDAGPGPGGARSSRLLAKLVSLGAFAALPGLTSIVIVMEPPSLADIGLCVLSWVATALFADRMGGFDFSRHGPRTRAHPSD